MRIERMLAGIALVLIGGCRSAPIDPAGAGDLRQTTVSVSPADLYPRGDQRFIALDPGTREAFRVEITINGPEDGAGVWEQTTGLEALDGSKINGKSEERAGLTTLRRRADGSVALLSLVARTPSATDTADALYLFEPKLVTAPAVLRAGEPFEDTCDLRIVDLNNHSRVIKTGSATRRLELIGVQTLETERGKIETLRVRTEMALQMGAIRSVTTGEVWIERGVGAIAESSERVSRLMGVPVSRARTLSRLEGSLEPAQESSR